MAALAIAGAIAGRRRREALRLLAGRLGLRFAADKDYELPRRFGFLDKVQLGSNRYAFNVLSGSYAGWDMWAFDYHYETHSTTSRGGRRTHHHFLSLMAAGLPRPLPEVKILREGLLSKIAQAFGYDDIDFESAEFSRKFCVRSKDKRFAYDVCNPRMMEYLLANDDLSIEIENTALALVFCSSLSPAALERNLGRLAAVRGLLPARLFEGG
jgi:hypothetical protein